LGSNVRAGSILVVADAGPGGESDDAVALTTAPAARQALNVQVDA
jgi:hypothetical protein